MTTKGEEPIPALETANEKIIVANKKIKAKKEAFLSAVQENKTKKFFVCSHDNPDPDSLACCFAMKRILNFLGVEDVELLFCGEISHPQNRAMKRVLDIQIKRVTKNTDIYSGTEKPFVIFVDCCPGQNNVSLGLEANIAFDHHKVSAPKQTLWIHDDVGACSTLICDLLFSLTDNEQNCFDPDDELCRKVATALAVGIKTDTLDFLSENTNDDDFKAYKLLSPYIISDKFYGILNYELPAYMFDYETIAWQNKQSYPPYFITGLGFLEEQRSDCIPYLADKMMRMEGIQTVVVYGIIENEIKASIRTRTQDVQLLINEVFGENSGGGKTGIGGVRLNLGVFSTEDMEKSDRELIWNLTKNTIERRFKKAAEK